MHTIVGKDNYGIRWYDVWRVTCDVCGLAVEGVDAPLDAAERGWERSGPLDECVDCRNRAIRDAER